MNIYISDIETTFTKIPKDSILLVKKGWDDYGYKGTFTVYFRQEVNKNTYVGEIKLLQKNKPTLVLKKHYKHLPSNCCSLGRNISFYHEAKSVLGGKYEIFLEILNDIVYSPGLYDEFKDDRRMRDSLLRDDEAQYAFDNAFKTFSSDDEDIRDIYYQTVLVGADAPHKAIFKFDIKSPLPGRINAIVGRNGVGKTQYLNSLVRDMGEKRRNNYSRTNDIDTIKYPHFNRIISLSFSPFDDFRIPDNKKRFSYYYCGIRKPRSIKNKVKQFEELKAAGRTILFESKQSKLYNLLKGFVDDNSLDLLFDEFINNCDKPLTKGLSFKISSGQSICFIVLTQLLANIRSRSLIIFDEPELHLHPTLLSHLIRTLHDLVEFYNSTAIISTHSPITIQELPSQYVQVFERKGNTPYIGKLGLESFGENLTNITEEIFETNGIEATYKSVFKRMKKKGLSLKDVDKMFNGRLSINAQIYLESIYGKQ